MNETADLAGDDASIVTVRAGVVTVRGGDATTGAFLTRFLGFPYAMPMLAALAFAMALWLFVNGMTGFSFGSGGGGGL